MDHPSVAGYVELQPTSMSMISGHPKTGIQNEMGKEVRSPFDNGFH